MSSTNSTHAIDKLLEQIRSLRKPRNGERQLSNTVWDGSEKDKTFCSSQLDILYDELQSLLQVHPANEELSASFSPKYLRSILEIHKPAHALKRLTICLKYHEKLKAIDDALDKECFEKLVESDFYMLSGATAKEGRPILWIREGPHQKRSWAIKHNSPQYWAFIRAQIFGFQASAAAVSDGPFPVASFFFDVAEQGTLDFNVRMADTSFRYLHHLFPIDPVCGKVFGSGLAQCVLTKVYRKIIPRSSELGWEYLSSKELDVILPLVRDRNSIPTYIFDNVKIERDGRFVDQGTPYNKEKNGLTWMYKRISREGYHLTAADVFNARQYFPSDDEDSSTDMQAAPRPISKLESIREEDEDDGGW